MRIGKLWKCAEDVKKTFYNLIEYLTCLHPDMFINRRLRHSVYLLYVQGQVVENGSHSSLLAKGGKYATMWSRQANVDDSSSLELFTDNQHTKQE